MPTLQRYWTQLLILAVSQPFNQLALGVILATGFDEPLKEWRRDKLYIGQESTLQDTLAEVASTIVPWAVLPPWVFNIPNKKLVQFQRLYETNFQLLFTRIKRVGLIYSRFKSMVKARIASRKLDLANAGEPFNTPRDLFSRLVQANSEDGNLSLNDHEVLGNCFALLFTGHGNYSPLEHNRR